MSTPQTPPEQQSGVVQQQQQRQEEGNGSNNDELSFVQQAKPQQQQHLLGETPIDNNTEVAIVSIAAQDYIPLPVAELSKRKRSRDTSATNPVSANVSEAMALLKQCEESYWRTIERLTKQEKGELFALILRTERVEDRSAFQQQFLSAQCMQIEFFDNISKNYGAQVVTNCLNALKYTEMSAGQVLFEQGDRGTRFFIILEGLVEVVVRMHTSAAHVASQPQERTTAAAAATAAGSTASTKTTKTSHNNNNHQNQKVSQIGAGVSFGEVGLMNDNAKRSATVKTLSQCSFAYLEKSDFVSILGFEASQKINERYSFIKDYSFFDEFTYRELLTFSYHFNEVQFNRGEVVYEAMDERIDDVYFVKEGNFMLQAVLETAQKYVPNLKEKRNKKSYNIYPLLYRTIFGLEYFNMDSIQQYQEELAALKSTSMDGSNGATVNKRVMSIGQQQQQQQSELSKPFRMGRVVCDSIRGSLYRVKASEIDARLWKEESREKFLSLQSTIFLKQAAKMKELVSKSIEERASKDLHAEQGKYIKQSVEFIGKTSSAGAANVAQNNSPRLLEETVAALNMGGGGESPEKQSLLLIDKLRSSSSNIISQSDIIKQMRSQSPQRNQQKIINVNYNIGVQPVAVSAIQKQESIIKNSSMSPSPKKQQQHLQFSDYQQIYESTIEQQQYSSPQSRSPKKSHRLAKLKQCSPPLRIQGTDSPEAIIISQEKQFRKGMYKELKLNLHKIKGKPVPVAPQQIKSQLQLPQFLTFGHRKSNEVHQKKSITANSPKLITNNTIVSLQSLSDSSSDSSSSSSSGSSSSNSERNSQDKQEEISNTEGGIGITDEADKASSIIVAFELTQNISQQEDQLVDVITNESRSMTLIAPSPVAVDDTVAATTSNVSELALNNNSLRNKYQLRVLPPQEDQDTNNSTLIEGSKLINSHATSTNLSQMSSNIHRIQTTAATTTVGVVDSPKQIDEPNAAQQNNIPKRSITAASAGSTPLPPMELKRIFMGRASRLFTIDQQNHFAQPNSPSPTNPRTSAKEVIDEVFYFCRSRNEKISRERQMNELKSSFVNGKQAAAIDTATMTPHRSNKPKHITRAAAAAAATTANTIRGQADSKESDADLSVAQSLEHYKRLKFERLLKTDQSNKLENLFSSDLVELARISESSQYSSAVKQRYQQNQKQDKLIFDSTATIVKEQSFSYMQVREYFSKLNHTDRFFQDLFIQKKPFCTLNEADTPASSAIARARKVRAASHSNRNSLSQKRSSQGTVIDALRANSAQSKLTSIVLKDKSHLPATNGMIKGEGSTSTASGTEQTTNHTYLSASEALSEEIILAKHAAALNRSRTPSLAMSITSMSANNPSAKLKSFHQLYGLDSSVTNWRRDSNVHEVSHFNRPRTATNSPAAGATANPSGSASPVNTYRCKVTTFSLPSEPSESVNHVVGKSTPTLGLLSADADEEIGDTQGEQGHEYQRFTTSSKNRTERSASSSDEKVFLRQPGFLTRSIRAETTKHKIKGKNSYW